VLAVIDDDDRLQNRTIVNTPIISINQISLYDHDGTLVSSYKHHKAIRSNLLDIDYPKEKIIEFFE